MAPSSRCFTNFTYILNHSQLVWIASWVSPNIQSSETLRRICPAIIGTLRWSLGHPLQGTSTSLYISPESQLTMWIASWFTSGLPKAGSLRLDLGYRFTRIDLLPFTVGLPDLPGTRASRFCCCSSSPSARTLCPKASSSHIHSVAQTSPVSHVVLALPYCTVLLSAEDVNNIALPP